MPNKKDMDLVAKKISGMDKEEMDLLQKARRSRLILSKRQKELKKIVKQKISGMSKIEKLKSMTPAGVQKLMDDAAAELKEMEKEDEKN